MSKAAEARRQQARREKEYEEVLRKQFKRVQDQALAMGAFSMCKVILDKANEEGVNDADRLENIRKFCMVMIKDVSAENPELENKEEKKDEV